MEKYKLIEAFLSTLFYSWASEAAPEVTWAANDYLKVFELEYSCKLTNRFSESYDEALPDNNYENVLAELKAVLTHDDEKNK